MRNIIKNTKIIRVWPRCGLLMTFPIGWSPDWKQQLHTIPNIKRTSALRENNQELEIFSIERDIKFKSIRKVAAHRVHFTLRQWRENNKHNVVCMGQGTDEVHPMPEEERSSDRLFMLIQNKRGLETRPC
jgi:hypothetical protein